VAKALGNGVPVGACLARESVARLLGPGSHGTTFGGNPLACRVGLEVIRIMQEMKLPEVAREKGEKLKSMLRKSLTNHPHVVDIRGRGLMIGIELNQDVSALKDAAMAKGLVMNMTRGNTIRLLPPLIIDDEQIAQISDTVTDLVNQHVSDSPLCT